MKKILLSLFVGFVGIISFCNAGSYTFEGDGNNIPSALVPPQVFFDKNVSVSCTFNLGDCNGNDGIDVFKLRFQLFFFYNSSQTSVGNDYISEYMALTCGDGNTHTFTFNYDFASFVPSQSYYTYYGFNFIKFYGVTNYEPSLVTYSCTFSGSNIIDSNISGGGGSCPEVNTGEILSGYILESEVDSNYCVSNDLCPVYENNSLLYINTIEHQSAPVINIDIPLEYDWDSSIDSGVFNLVISGNNVDYEYIDGIITAQNVKPDSGTLNKIITELIPLFVPGLVIILFIWFVFRFIKKIF